VAEAILFGGALPANRRWIGRASPRRKKGGEIFSWGISLSPIQPCHNSDHQSEGLDLGIGFSVWLVKKE
jgi:hypothetical protein